MSRASKTLSRVVCDKRMSLIVDDSIDVWVEDLPNLCLTRRFVGDMHDDGLMLLSGQLDLAHRAFFADAPAEGYSYDAAASGSPRAAPSMHGVLAGQRGKLLAGCRIALTGVVSEQRDESDIQPLCVLIRLYGGEHTLSVDAATHLVARRKEGWEKSPKISRALNRIQVRPPGVAVPLRPSTCRRVFFCTTCIATSASCTAMPGPKGRWRGGRLRVGEFT